MKYQMANHAWERNPRRSTASSIASGPCNARRLKSIIGLLPFCAMLSVGTTPVSAATVVPPIQVLSNRADLISGGDALVQIGVPPGINVANGIKVALNGTLVNSMFAMRPNGAYMGLVAGLNNGDNLLTVRTAVGSSQMTITNHPIGGPVFAGTQLQHGYVQPPSQPRSQ